MGSSASTNAGLVTIARARATRCCWPPDISLGMVCCGRQARPVRARARRAPRRSARLTPRTASGNSTFTIALVRGIEVERLEDEPDLAVADMRQRRLVERAHVDPVDEELARRRDVEAAEDVHHRRLAADPSAHDRDEVAAFDRSDTPRRACTRICAELEDLCDIAHLDHRAPPRGLRDAERPAAAPCSTGAPAGGARAWCAQPSDGALGAHSRRL